MYQLNQNLLNELVDSIELIRKWLLDLDQKVLEEENCS